MYFANQLSEPRFTCTPNSRFIIEGTDLTILSTDVINPKRPPPGEVITKKGHKRWYKRETLDNETCKKWRTRLGEKLCHWLLLLDYGKDLHKSFRLTRFPPGYYFYTRNIAMLEPRKRIFTQVAANIIRPTKFSPILRG